MPYLIDQAENFGKITNAAIRVLDRAGLVGLTWLAVAREAEMSVSAVRHRCDLDHDRLVRLVVVALLRARAQRVESGCGPSWAGPTPLARALAVLPRTDVDRADARVAAMLATDPRVPEAAAWLLRKAREDERDWCLRAQRGDAAAGALLHVTITGLEVAVSDRESPLDRAVAEEVLRALLADRTTLAGTSARRAPRDVLRTVLRRPSSTPTFRQPAPPSVMGVTPRRPRRSAP